MIGTNEQYNANSIDFKYSKEYLPLINVFILVPKMLHLQLCLTLLKKISNLPKWSCVLNFYSEFPGVFVTNAKKLTTKIWRFHLFIFITMKMLSLVLFTRNYFLVVVNMSSMNESINSEKLKFIILDSYSKYCMPVIEEFYFCIPHVYIIGKITLKVKYMTYL